MSPSFDLKRVLAPAPWPTSASPGRSPVEAAMRPPLRARGAHVKKSLQELDESKL
jgi:hypothetical protein